jgi:hypothetical protein
MVHEREGHSNLAPVRAALDVHVRARRVYSLDNGMPVSENLAAELINPDRLQGDLFLGPNEDGLFTGFTQRKDDTRTSSVTNKNRTHCCPHKRFWVLCGTSSEVHNDL